MLRAQCLMAQQASRGSRARVMPLVIAKAKADPPGTMRCPMCGGRFTDPEKLYKHFEMLHVHA
jgi:hypothetical protein